MFYSLHCMCTCMRLKRWHCQPAITLSIWIYMSISTILNKQTYNSSCTYTTISLLNSNLKIISQGMPHYSRIVCSQIIEFYIFVFLLCIEFCDIDAVNIFEFNDVYCKISWHWLMICSTLVVMLFIHIAATWHAWILEVYYKSVTAVLSLFIWWIKKRNWKYTFMFIPM